MPQKSPLKTCPCCGRLIAGGTNLTVNLDYNTASRKGLMIPLEPQSAAVLHTIERAWPGTATYDRLETAMHGHTDHPGDFQSVLKVRICRLRQILKPLRIGIANVYGAGYRLELL